MKATYVDKKTIVTTSEGNEILEPGDITKEEVVAGSDVQQLHGATPKNPGEIWETGRPLEVITKDKKFTVNRSRLNNTYSDMDHALPKEILSRRKKLIMDRMKQERRS